MNNNCANNSKSGAVLRTKELSVEDSIMNETENNSKQVNKLIDLDHLNPLELLTSTEVLENIEMYDATV